MSARMYLAISLLLAIGSFVLIIYAAIGYMAYSYNRLLVDEEGEQKKG